jgi:hypothetical protein
MFLFMSVGYKIHAGGKAGGKVERNEIKYL